MNLVRSLSQTTLDSLDYATISEDGDRAGGDRVAILEFELRKARETITALRENLTQQVEQENASIRSDTESTGSRNHHSTPQQFVPEPIRAFEQRAINFLVHEYLLTNGYRMTSITFADENTEQVSYEVGTNQLIRIGVNHNYMQDFEHWDDVGLNTERPPDLLTVFRHRTKPAHLAHTTQMKDAESQTDDLLHDHDSADVTMQMSGVTSAADSSLSNSEELTSSGLVRLNQTPSEPTEPPLPALDHRLVPSVQSAQVFTATSSLSNIQASRIPVPTANFPPEPHSAPFPHPVAIPSSARALKDDFQQGVEDVCQKLNSLFGKPPSLSGSSSSRGGRTMSFPFPPSKSTDRSPFSLFNTK